MGESIIMCGSTNTAPDGSQGFSPFMQGFSQLITDKPEFQRQLKANATIDQQGIFNNLIGKEESAVPEVQRTAPKSKRSNKKKKTSTGLTVGNAKKLANSGKRKARPEGKSLQI